MRNTKRIFSRVSLICLLLVLLFSVQQIGTVVATPPTLPPFYIGTIKLEKRIVGVGEKIPIIASLRHTAFEDYYLYTNIADYILNDCLAYVEENWIGEVLKYYGIEDGEYTLKASSETEYIVKNTPVIAEAYLQTQADSVLLIISADFFEQSKEQYEELLKHHYAVPAIHAKYEFSASVLERLHKTAAEFNEILKENFRERHGYWISMYEAEVDKRLGFSGILEYSWSELIDTPELVQTPQEERLHKKTEFELKHVWKERFGKTHTETLASGFRTPLGFFETGERGHDLSCILEVGKSTVSGSLIIDMGYVLEELYYFVDDGKVIFTYREGKLRNYEKYESYKNNEAITVRTMSESDDEKELYAKKGCAA